MVAKAWTAIAVSDEAGRGAKMPVALGLILGAGASVGLWAGVYAAIRALFH